MEKVENQVGVVNKVTPLGNTLNPTEQPRVMKPFVKKEKKWFYPLAALVVVAAGVVTGWVLSNKRVNGSANVPEAKVAADTTAAVQNDATESGSSNSTDPNAEAPTGILQAGGKNGEGTHHLDRGLGPEKDVYLLSTVMDLDSFIGKKVQVWGDTLGAKEVGWLMDVVKIKVIE